MATVDSTKIIAQARQKYTKDLASGKLQKKEDKFLGIIPLGYHYEYNIGKDSVKVGDLKQKYNLPDGTFKRTEYVYGMPSVDGSKDNLKFPPNYSVPIKANLLETALKLK